MRGNIRRAMMGDVESCARIQADSWRKAYRDILPEEELAKRGYEQRIDRWKQIIAEGPEQFVYEYNGKIIGFVGVCEPRDDDLGKETLELQGIYFAPEYLGLGFGRETIKFVLNKAKEEGYKRVSLWVFAENGRAKRAYEKCGFRPDGKEKTVAMGRDVLEQRYICEV